MQDFLQACEEDIKMARFDDYKRPNKTFQSELEREYQELKQCKKDGNITGDLTL